MDITKFLAGTKLTPKSKRPLYLQLAQILESKIKSNELVAGTKLPPERELALLMDISRTTEIGQMPVPGS